MASTKLAFMAAVAVLLLQASWCAVARARHHHHLEVSPQGGTPAVMTVNSFERGGDGEGPSDCDGRYRHSNRDLITALSTGWYAGGKRCHKKIRITSVQNGRTVEATVVDECDSHQGCKNNIVDTSQAVWDALGLDSYIGVVPVTWSDA